MFLFHNILSKMNGNVKESSQFLLLISVMYQGYEMMNSYCVNFIMLVHTRRIVILIDNIACPLGHYKMQ